MQDRGLLEYLKWLFFKDRAVSLRVFNIVVTGVLMWGYLCVYLTLNYLPQFSFASEQVLWVIGAYLLTTIVGFWLAYKSDKPLFSFIGYSAMNIGTALFFSYFLPEHGIEIISQLIKFVAVVTVLMMSVSICFARVFDSLTAMLLLVLACLAVTEFGWFMLSGEFKPLVHWIGIYLFCAFVGFQWKEYNGKYETLDKAIDFGSGLYIDIVGAIISTLAQLNARR
ncbi:hypothetical protein [Shewanella youngdeokensis]|uniref:Histidine kinase n=1 Tax=Shewanella youngdeokensis TaxID=2999068 RepID=A0ABZ0JWP0_9GAMM|nr:hypothetical protein RGE70_15645 [Shewanella sp. DAU334]